VTAISDTHNGQQRPPHALMDGDEDWEASEGGGQGEAVISRRFSLTSLTDRLAKAGETIARKAAAAGELVLDRDLRTRSAALLAGGAGKAAKGAHHRRTTHRMPHLVAPLTALVPVRVQAWCREPSA
jgi:hypothetical protein